MHETLCWFVCYVWLLCLEPVGFVSFISLQMSSTFSVKELEVLLASYFTAVKPYPAEYKGLFCRAVTSCGDNPEYVDFLRAIIKAMELKLPFTILVDYIDIHVPWLKQPNAYDTFTFKVKGYSPLEELRTYDLGH